MNIFITGSTDGIGKQSALELARLGHTVFIHGRNKIRLSETRDWIQSQVPTAKTEAFYANFASLKEVKKMADHFLSKGHDLDVLINNAGVFEKQLTYSVDGYERTFAINHLAHFYLTHLLLPKLKKRPSARIINVASMAQASGIDFKNLNAEKSFNPYQAYELSKLCNVLFTFKLANELKANSITVNAVHPGEINTKILQAGWGTIGGSLKSGAATTVFLANSSEGAQNTGHYYVNKKKEKASRAAYVVENQDLLWKESLKMCKLGI